MSLLISDNNPKFMSLHLVRSCANASSIRYQKDNYLRPGKDDVLISKDAQPFFLLASASVPRICRDDSFINTILREVIYTGESITRKRAKDIYTHTGFETFANPLEHSEDDVIIKSKSVEYILQYLPGSNELRNRGVQILFSMKVNGYMICYYKSTFGRTYHVLINRDGKYEKHEIKPKDLHIYEGASEIKQIKYLYNLK